MTGSIEEVGNWLLFVFQTYVYPTTLFVTMAALLISIGFIILRAQGGSDAVRRIIAALVPKITLTFLLLVDRGNDTVRTFLLSISQFAHLVGGAIVGLAIMEAAHHIDLDEASGSSFFVLFLSTTLSYTIYSLMLGVQGSLNYFMFAALIAGGFHVLFRGPPGSH